MQLAEIDNAIGLFCGDIVEFHYNKSYENMTEEEILFELIISLLGSGVKYEMALAYSESILSLIKETSLQSNDKIPRQSTLKELLCSKTHSPSLNVSYSSYRYPNRGAMYIHRTLSNIYIKYDSIKNLLSNVNTTKEARELLIAESCGIGPKQASHFLKNIGYSDDLAVIDRHILEYLKLKDIYNNSKRHISKLEEYERIERIFQNEFREAGYPLSVIDQSIWFIMRNIESR